MRGLLLIFIYSKKRLSAAFAADNHCQLLFIEQNLHHLDSGLRNGSTGTEDGSDASLIEEVVVLGGNDTTSNDHNVLTTKLFQLFNQLRNERLVTSGK